MKTKITKATKAAAMKGNKELKIFRGSLTELTVRKNCVLANSVKEVPDFLVQDGAVSIVDETTIKLFAVEGSVERKFPVYICWEEVSTEKADSVPGKFGSWPKDNGATTLTEVEGKFYNLPTTNTAVVITKNIPSIIKDAGFPVSIEGNTAKLTRTDWGGEVRTGTVGNALWVSYGPNDVNILAATEKSASEYNVLIDGIVYGTVAEFFEKL